MAVVIVKLFEENPEHWESVRWLNSKASPEGQSFERYLGQWHQAVHQRHQKFVQQIADLYRFKIETR